MTTTVKLFGFLILFSLCLISCNKDCDKVRELCDINECNICKEKTFEGKKDHIYDHLGNKFTWDQFDQDSHGKFLLDANGHKMYCNKDATGGFYTDTNGNKVYFKGLDWNNKDKNVEKYILEPLVMEEDCGYIIKGKIKYVVNGETSAIVDYGDGIDDAWAVKTIYFHKKGKNKQGKKVSKCCKFKQPCKKETPATKIDIINAQKGVKDHTTH